MNRLMDEDKLGTLISKLDTSAGMLIVAAMKDQTVRKAMELVTEVSIELGDIACELEERD